MQLSETSKQEAKDFATKHGLNSEAETELAELLERTWQDGGRAEAFRNIFTDVFEGIPEVNVEGESDRDKLKVHVVVDKSEE